MNQTQDPYTFMQKAYEDARTGYEANVRMWHFDKVKEWAIDPIAGTITFTLPTQIATGPVQVIGTLSKDDPIELNGRAFSTTFMWAWGHPSVPESLQEAAYVIKDWGEKMGHPLLTNHIVPADESTATTFMALGASLYGGFTYEVETAPTTRMYMIFNDLRFKDK
ncbi:MAG: DUF6882 domain-containing protein [Candidatus Saccharimonadales bacterium]